MIIGRNFVNDYYEDERLYSTGDYELDELMERAFCEGYEYALEERLYFQDPVTGEYYTAMDKNTGKATKKAMEANKKQAQARYEKAAKRAAERAERKKVDPKVLEKFAKEVRKEGKAEGYRKGVESVKMKDLVKKMSKGKKAAIIGGAALGAAGLGAGAYALGRGRRNRMDAAAYDED